MAQFWQTYQNEIMGLVNILLSIVLGFLIGFERKLRSKEAGIRTHTVICLSSALFMVISKYAFEGLGDFDAARIAAQIIPGVGFLGAGIIVYRKYEVFGLTTAAGVLATAGVGMACGGGLYFVAVGATILLIATQLVFHSKNKIFRNKRVYRLNIIFEQGDNEAMIVKNIFAVEHFHRFRVERKQEKVYCEATLFTECEYPSNKLNDIMREFPFITSIQRVDE